jgi:hypothetical protein
MAWTLSEVQTILTALKAQYLQLASSAATETSIDGRAKSMRDMAAVKSQIDEFHAIEAGLDPDPTDASAVNAAGGVAYAEFHKPG